jgi:multiple sugar transport system substrate-binding protein/sn-glycerol 3-phosphate transport system substrate-binding protein
MKIRNHFLILAFMVILSVAISSCKKDVDPTGQEISYWYQHSRGREETLQDMIEDFNASNGWGIKVEGEYAGDYEEIYDKIVSGCATGDVPNIAVAYQNQAATYVTLDCIVELTDYIESPQWGFTEEELGDFFPFVEKGDFLIQFDGRYGIPPQRSMEVLYYNEDWLGELGYNHPPNTWDEFKEMACAASDPEAGTHGFELDVDASTFASMLYNQGGVMLNEEVTAYAFGNQSGLDVLTLLWELFDENCAIVQTEAYGDQTDFVAEEVLFTISSTSSLPYYRSDIDEGAGFAWSISTLPTVLDSPMVNIYGASLSILKTTPEEQLASWLFIKWLTEKEQSAHWTRASNYFPVRKSAAAELTDYFGESPQFEKAFSFLTYDIAIEPGVVGYDECREWIKKMLDGVSAGEDPETWLSTTLQECNSYWMEGKTE